MLLIVGSVRDTNNLFPKVGCNQIYLLSRTQRLHKCTTCPLVLPLVVLFSSPSWASLGMTSAPAPGRRLERLVAPAPLGPALAGKTYPPSSHLPSFPSLVSSTRTPLVTLVFKHQGPWMSLQVNNHALLHQPFAAMRLESSAVL